jgi:hypothetical protein
MSGGSIAERQQALLVARLQAIRVSNGYLCDMGARVYEERAHFDEADTFPLLNVQMTAETVDGDQFGERIQVERTWRVEVWRSTADDLAIALLQDVKRALMDRGSLGNFADDDGKLGALTYGGTESLALEQDGHDINGLSALFSVKGPETWGEPRATT